jgi:hypothetical protein
MPDTITIKLDPLGAVALYKLLSEFQSATREQIIKDFCQEIMDQIKNEVSTISKEEEKVNAA